MILITYEHWDDNGNYQPSWELQSDLFDTDEIDAVIHKSWWLIEHIVKNNDEDRKIYGYYKNLKVYRIGEDITEQIMGTKQVTEYKEEIERQSRMEEEEWKKKELEEKEREKQERYEYYQKLKKEFEGENN